MSRKDVAQKQTARTAWHVNLPEMSLLSVGTPAFHASSCSVWCISGIDAQEVALDETVAANPEEIELDEDDIDAEEVSNEALEETAEAAKQDMAEDNSMFQSESLHNFGGGAQAAQGPENLTELPDSRLSPADGRTQTSPALAAIVSQRPDCAATAPKPNAEV